MAGPERPRGAEDVARAEDEAVLSAFAHDVRSIGAAAEGLAFRAGARVDDPRVKSYLEAIRESMARLSSMASRALELARSGEQSPRTVRETIEVQEVVRTVATTMEEAFSEAGATCVLDLGPGTVLADRTAVYRIVLNLLTNALLHGTHRSGSRVTVSVGRRDDRVVLCVADEGPGFPRALLGSFPTPSWQAGRGLGLAIVARLVLQHGGTIALSNGAAGTPARGAVVTLELPVAPSPP